MTSVARATLYRKDLTLREPIRHTGAPQGIDRLEEAYLVLEDGDGRKGYGEVRGNCPYIHGDTRQGILDVVARALPRLMGRDPLQVAGLIQEVRQGLGLTAAAIALVDLALHDLAAKRLGIPLYVLLGGRASAELPSNQTIPFGTPDEAEGHAVRYLAEGYGQLKLRVGMRPFQMDLDRFRAVAAVAVGRASLAVDANQAWTPKEAIRNIRALHAVAPLEYMEQPTPARDFHALRQVTAATEVPIMADESLQSPRDALELIRLQAVDLLHIKLVKVGGLIPARQVMAIAEAAGVGYMMGQVREGRVAAAAAAHAAVASRARYVELYSMPSLIDDPASGLDIENGRVRLPSGPGVGVQLDEDRLELVHTYPGE
ncbi:MAG: hypothetical protein A3G35_12825 [candidate division NC10 bacterium RIFCSPLOWO2_12_FULL_66_18]|nr:MAG: hypothetical protein A3G35_12825 [candidate division NC10 bacterium RIFCSPLOWO2_12_FULL_66_18]